MAESRYKISTVGAPFDIKYSSCSNIEPKNFNWTDKKTDKIVYIDRGMFNLTKIVYIDRGMFNLTDQSIKKENTFGWICESNHIVPDVISFLIHNHKTLFENYYNKIFTCDKELIKLNPNFIYCPSGSNYPWISKDNWSIYSKSKICSMFCSPKLRTPEHYYRHDIAKLAMSSGIDVFGGALGSQRTVTDPMNPWFTKLQGIKDYMFSIVMENGVYDSYWTEKLTDCFATGTIPIYWGTSDLPKEIDETGIIRLEKGKEKDIIKALTSELYFSKYEAIKTNFNFVNNLKLADDYLFEFIKD